MWAWCLLREAVAWILCRLGVHTWWWYDSSNPHWERLCLRCGRRYRLREGMEASGE